MAFPILRARGFTLIEIVVVLLVFGVVISMVATITRGVVAGQKRSLTATRMAAIDAALVQFVVQQKRLPCPADGTKNSSANDAGTEVGQAAGGCTGTQAGGVVPWRALGLTETEATDGWDRRLTYRLHAALGGTNALDMSWCDPAGTGPLVGGVCRNDGGCSATALPNCTPPATYLAGKGLEVRNAAGTVLMNPNGTPHTGAAYVLISHGETGGGGYLGSGTLAATNATADGTEEQKNYANLALQAYYVDSPVNDTGGNNHFDDIVSRPAVLTVVTKAGLGPRTH